MKGKNMKLIGIVKNYNGKYGTIVTQDKEKIDFINKDVSFEQEINERDLVEFRIENKTGGLKLARNVNKLKINQGKIDDTNNN